MKLIRYFLAIIGSLLLVTFSISVYDDQIQEKFFKEIEPYYHSGFVFLNSSDLDRDFVVTNIIQVASKNNVSVHIPFGTVDDRTHYIYTEDQNIIESFLLEGNRLIDFSANKMYASSSIDYDTRIFKPTKKGSITVYPLTTYITDKNNIKGEYLLYSENSQDLKNFKQEITLVFKDYILHFYDVDPAENHDSVTQMSRMDSQSFSLLLSIELIIAISIVLKLIRNTKKISILNVEGHSRKSIIASLILEDILLAFLIIPLLSILFYVLVFSMA